MENILLLTIIKGEFFMKRKYKLICMFPVYIIAVIFSCIITLPISWIPMIVDKAYFNPIKLKWTYFNGDDYSYYFEPSVTYLLSPLTFLLLLMLIPLIIKAWIYVLSFIVIVLIIIGVFYLSRDVADILFNKENDK